MRLDVVDRVCAPGGAINEDRVGGFGPFAWVIDGATDVIDRPVTPDPTDAAWFAATLDGILTELARDWDSPLDELPYKAAAACRAAFDRVAFRPLDGPEEQPSASAMIVRVTAAGLDYVSLGDCSLLARFQGRVTRVGVDEADAGDAWVAEALMEQRRARAAHSALDRAELWPKLRAARRVMNQPGGYGVFSITAPPAQFVRSGHVPMTAGEQVLLASDGLMRLSDIFRRYNLASLYDAAMSRGLKSLVEELRTAEVADADCVSFPRAKTSDDASGLILKLS